MARAPKQPVAPTPASELFRRNLKRLIDADAGLGSANLAAKVAGVGQRSVSRILAGEQSPTLDMVYKLALAFQLEPWQMLIEGLDPRDPPITKQVDERQRQLLDRFRLAAEQLADYNANTKGTP